MSKQDHNKDFDFERFKQQAREQLQDGASLLGADGVLTPLIKQFLEESLEAELDAHLDEETSPNRRNGKGKKHVRTSLGPVEVTTPRDRHSSFQPKILPKGKRQLGRDLDRQIIALYARGSSYGDIRDYLAEMYDLEVSTATISRVTDKILPLPHDSPLSGQGSSTTPTNVHLWFEMARNLKSLESPIQVYFQATVPHTV